MSLNCKSCGAEISAGNVNLERMVAKCSACNAVFSFADDFQYADTSQLAYQKFNVETPKGMKAEHMGIGLKITRNWFSPVIFLLVFFALFWNGFMLFWFAMAYSSGAWLMAAFGLPHAGVGLGLIYYILASALNVTEVTVNSRDLKVRHRPLPWPGKKDLPSTDISQVYCKEKIRRSRRSSRTTYEVHAVSHDNKQEKLVTGLPNSEQALFLEQEIERFLGIKDRPVRGEVTA